MKNPRSPILEVWADSFREGEWFLQELATRHYDKHFSTELRHCFQPVYTFGPKEDPRFIAEVYGDYKSWSNVPRAVKSILGYGKPDIIAYDPLSDKVLMCVEETAAVPTGNQSLQRLERVWFAAKSRFPFVYLIGEYGLHKDGGIRRSSIWPTYLALKLSSQFKVVSLTLLYGSPSAPENYQVGSGQARLADFSNLIFLEWLGSDVREAKRRLLRQIFEEMVAFVRSQMNEIATYLPGSDMISSDAFLNFLVERATSE